jgi:hypothetical protein
MWTECVGISVRDIEDELDRWNALRNRRGTIDRRRVRKIN